MKPLIRQIARLLGAAFIAVVIGALPVAKAAVPTDIAERLRQTAGLWQTSIEQQKQMQQLSNLQMHLRRRRVASVRAVGARVHRGGVRRRISRRGRGRCNRWRRSR